MNILAPNEVILSADLNENFDVVFYEEIARSSQSDVGDDTITLSSIPARKHLRIIFVGIASGGTLDSNIVFNSDGGANYANSNFNHSNVYNSAGSATSFAMESSTTASGGLSYVVMDVINYATAEKLLTGVNNNTGSTGGANAPRMYNFVGKWANTSAQISSITWTNAGTGNFGAGSEIIVLGHD
jgi:hypothetical protein